MSGDLPTSRKLPAAGLVDDGADVVVEVEGWAAAAPIGVWLGPVDITGRLVASFCFLLDFRVEVRRAE